ncbi:MAG: hypothetical protein ACREV6_04515 [Clostridium sp.]|uniref:hypothetical protein n=1 Tax=Clostridium sp. TaxID=1506 RepID=UPI003D6D45BC
MMKEDILKDEFLEALGLIKEIDTLSIIENGESIKEKRGIRLNNIAMLMLTFIIVAMNYIVLLTLGIKIFLIIQIILSWIITIIFLPLLKINLYRRS